MFWLVCMWLFLLLCCSETALYSWLDIRSYRERCEGLAGRCARPSGLFRCKLRILQREHWPLSLACLIVRLIIWCPSASMPWLLPSRALSVLCCSLTVRACSHFLFFLGNLVILCPDETHQSEWCVHELNTAKASGIPIICVIDQDHFHQVSEILCLFGAT